MTNDELGQGLHEAAARGVWSGSVSPPSCQMSFVANHGLQLIAPGFGVFYPGEVYNLAEKACYADALFALC